MNTATLQPRATPPAQDQASRLRDLMAAVGINAPPLPQLIEQSPRQCPFLAISSGKGGVGKTNLAVNLAIALSQGGVKTTLLDADLGMANADVLCGLMPARRLELAVSGAANFRDAATALNYITVDAPGGFRLVPGAVGVRQMAALTAHERRLILDGLASAHKDAQLVIIDTGAGMNPAVTGFIEAADHTLVVTTPEPTAIADAYALIKCVAPRVRRSERGDVRMSLVVNQAKDEDQAAAVYGRIASVATRFLSVTVPWQGWVAEDQAVRSAVLSRSPLMLHQPKSRAAKEMRQLAASLARSLRLKYSPPGGNGGLISRVLGRGS